MALRDELRDATLGSTIIDGTVTWVVDAPLYTYQGADNSNKVFKVNNDGLAELTYLSASDVTSGVFSLDRIPDISKSKITDFEHQHSLEDLVGFDQHTHYADQIVYYEPEPEILYDPDTGEMVVDPETGEPVYGEAPLPPVFDVRLIPKLPFTKFRNDVMDSELSNDSEHPVKNSVIKAALDSKADSSTTIDGKALDDDILLSRVLSKVEYDALSSEEKNNGITYYVPDESTEGYRNLAQETGQSTVDTMSQKAITDELDTKQEKVMIIYA